MRSVRRAEAGDYRAGAGALGAGAAFATARAVAALGVARQPHGIDTTCDTSGSRWVAMKRSKVSVSMSK